MAVLTEKQIAGLLRSTKGWKRRGSEIQKIFIHKDFVRAMGFVQSVALLAEKMNHHPDIDIRWNKVMLQPFDPQRRGPYRKGFCSGRTN